MTPGQIVCPDCGQTVDRVDKEYARHYVDGVLCNKSKRSIVEGGEASNGV